MDQKALEKQLEEFPEVYTEGEEPEDEEEEVDFGNESAEEESDSDRIANIAVKRSQIMSIDQVMLDFLAIMYPGFDRPRIVFPIYNAQVALLLGNTNAVDISIEEYKAIARLSVRTADEILSHMEDNLKTISTMKGDE